ncbi:hypothetical protein IAC76_03140 [Spirochaetes bacterium]|uniref:Uncharacterized protein n=1 Tax=Candidatus Scatousia excrementipullorum TaxID=2840936 RepID=A0A9D9DMB5_9BACT|nr:hypothetical protein [Candidatus Scatousia excrementipullorum]
MGRKSKKNIHSLRNKVIAFIFSLFLIASGVYYITLNYVPQKLYETQDMRSGMNEAYYVSQWCSDDFGKREFVLWDNTRVDCLTKDYAIEFDFAKKWAESIGQALYYAKMTGKKPAVTLILTQLEDYKYVKRIERLDNGIKIFLIKAY